MDTSFRLGEDEHERIYSKAIEPAAFLDTSSVEHPRITIIAGQTGAGKSRLLELAKGEFADGNVVLVNTDDLRAFHPQFKEIIALDDKRSAERTHEDASAWSQKVLARSMETRRNIIWEGVFKDGQQLAATIAKLKDHGYIVTVCVVAVHERYSLWGIYRRYEKEKIVRGHGRYVPIEYHDECYRNLLDTIDLVESEKLPDAIEVYNRDGQSLYANMLASGRWKKPIGARASIEKERARHLTDEERTKYRASWDRLFEYMEDRHAPAEEIDAIRVLAKRFSEGA